MKYLECMHIFIFFFGASIFCTDLKITPQTFDMLYPITPSSSVTQHLMQIWQDIQHMMQISMVNDDHYYHLIGHIVHVADLLHELFDDNACGIADDTVYYWAYIIECIRKEARALLIHNSMLYKRLMQQLDILLRNIQDCDTIIEK